MSGHLSNTRTPYKMKIWNFWLDVEKKNFSFCEMTARILGTFIPRGLEASIPVYTKNA